MFLSCLAQIVTRLKDSSLSLLQCPCSLAGRQSYSSGAGTRARAGGSDRVVSPRLGRMLTARRPRCPASNIWSWTICWGCQSPHTPHTPDLSKESPMGNQAVIGLLEWFWSPFKKKYGTTKLYYHYGDPAFATILIQEEAWFCVTLSCLHGEHMTFHFHSSLSPPPQKSSFGYLLKQVRNSCWKIPV